MSAKIILMHPASKTWTVQEQTIDRPETMEEWANRTLTEAGVTPISENIPYGGSGIDGMGPKESA